MWGILNLVQMMWRPRGTVPLVAMLMFCQVGLFCIPTFDWREWWWGLNLLMIQLIYISWYITCYVLQIALDEDHKTSGVTSCDLRRLWLCLARVFLDCYPCKDRNVPLTSLLTSRFWRHGQGLIRHVVSAKAALAFQSMFRKMPRELEVVWAAHDQF